MVSVKLVADGILRGCGLMVRFMIATFTDLILRVGIAAVLSATALGSTGIWMAWPVGWCIGTGHVLPGVRRAAEAEPFLCEPERQRRSHTAQRRDTRPDGAAQPDERAVRVAPHKIRLGGSVAERGLTQDQKCCDKFKPAHAAHHAGGGHQRPAPAGRFAAHAGAMAEPKRRQQRQQPGPEAPVQVLHAALQPGGQQHRRKPERCRQRAEFFPHGQRRKQLRRVEQRAVQPVEGGFPRQTAGQPVPQQRFKRRI